MLSAPYNLTTDQRGRPRQARAHVDIGAYELQASTTFVVTNTNDSGAGSLRQAVADANNEAQPDAITFNIPTSDPGYDASTQAYSIKLASGELAITAPVSIDGGNARITVRRSATAAPFRLFNVSASGVTLSNLFLRNGAAVGGPSAPGLGGAVFNTGSLTLLNCAFFANTATGGAGTPQLYQGFPGGEAYGGAVFNGATLVMTNCTLFGNTAQGGANGQGYSANGVNGKGGNGSNGRGGGLFTDQGTVTLTYCTFTQNIASGGAGGAGDGGFGAAGSSIGGGVLFSSGSATLRNSIVSRNTAATDPDYSGTVSGNPNLIGATPNLDSGLKYNGGSTPTVALLAGSPAIDAGDDTYAPATDQRGYARVGFSDIGAFEFGSSAPTPTPGPSATATPTATPGPSPSPTATPPLASQLLNLSTRKQVGSGENVLIGGFIVIGSDDKKVIVRGLGPSLPVSGALADPTLEIHKSDTTLLAANSNWKDTQEGEINATGIPPRTDAESAIVFSLPAEPAASGGAGYTAILAGSGGGTGIGLLEIYDLVTAVNSKLANISTRGFVGTGDDVLIGGFIPGSSDRTAINVLLRGPGPSLSAQGVSGALLDPLLEWHDGNGTTLATNDRWKSDQQSAIEATGIPPNDEREAAIVTTLAPSNSGYTAVVRGADNSTGVALVEVYSLQ